MSNEANRFFDESDEEEDHRSGRGKQDDLSTSPPSADFDRLKMKPTPITGGGSGGKASSGKSSSGRSVGFSQISDADGGADDLDLEEPDFDEDGMMNGGGEDSSTGRTCFGLRPKQIFVLVCVLLVLVSIASWRSGWFESAGNVAAGEDADGGLLRDENGLPVDYNNLEGEPPASSEHTSPKKHNVKPADPKHPTTTPADPDNTSKGGDSNAELPPPEDLPLDDENGSSQVPPDERDEEDAGEERSMTTPTENGPSTTNTPNDSQGTDPITPPTTEEEKEAAAEEKLDDQRSDREEHDRQNEAEADQSKIEKELKEDEKQEAEEAAAAATQTKPKVEPQTDDVIILPQQLINDSTLIQEEAEALGVDPLAILENVGKNETEILQQLEESSSTSSLSKDPLFSSIQTKQDLLNLLKNAAKERNIHVPALSELPQGSDHIERALKKMHQREMRGGGGGGDGTYLDGLDVGADRRSMPRMKIDPWLRVNGRASSSILMTGPGSVGGPNGAGGKGRFRGIGGTGGGPFGSGTAGVLVPDNLRMCLGNTGSLSEFVVKSKQRLSGEYRGHLKQEYLVYSCSTVTCKQEEGLSEHILGVLYGFLLSIVTDRIFIVDWPESFPHVKYATFDYLQPEDPSNTFDASIQTFLDPNSPFSRAELGDKLFFQFQDSTVLFSGEPVYVEDIDRSINASPSVGVPLENLDFLDRWKGKKYVILEPPSLGLYLMPLLLKNPLVARYLETVFDLTPQTIFPCLMNILFKPQVPLLRAMEPYLSFLLDPSVFVVGIQGRFHDKFRPDRGSMNMIEEEGLSRSKLRELKSMSPVDRAAYHASEARHRALGSPFECAREVWMAFEQDGEITDGFGMWHKSGAGSEGGNGNGGPSSMVQAKSKPLRFFFISNSKLLRNAVVEKYPSQALVLNITVAGEVGGVSDTPLPTSTGETAAVAKDAFQSWQYEEKQHRTEATWMEFWLFGLCDHHVVPTVGHAGSFGKLAALRGFVQERGGNRDILGHIWDGTRHFQPTCRSRAAALSMDQLCADADKMDAAELRKEQLVLEANAKVAQEVKEAAAQAKAKRDAANQQAQAQQQNDPEP